MESLARVVMHHRRLISAVWFVLFAAGLFAASALSDRLSLDFSLPGQPGSEAEEQLIETYGVSTFDTFVAVVTVPEGQTVEQQAPQVAKVFDSLRESVPAARVVDLASAGDEAFVSDDGRTTFALVQAPNPRVLTSPTRSRSNQPWPRRPRGQDSTVSSRHTACCQPVVTPRVRACWWRH